MTHEGGLGMTDRHVRRGVRRKRGILVRVDTAEAGYEQNAWKAPPKVH
jgi:hypothetical protein